MTSGLLRRLTPIWLGLTIGAALPARAGVVAEWNELALDLIRSGGVSPPMASRALAMAQVAVFDAVNSVDRTYRPYHVRLDAAPGTSREAATISAAHAVLRSLFPGQSVRLDAAREAGLGRLSQSAGVDEGVRLGTSVAAEIIALRADDGSEAASGYTPGTAPGQWRPTPPGFAPGLLPQWPGVTPFAIPSADAFRAAPPPALESAEYAAAFLEVKELGSADSALRTADQTHIATFWAAGAGTVTPPGMWNQIARVVGEAEGLSLLEQARLLGLLNVALADAAIACWDTKYHYDRWRPVTAIREADVDGNPLTEADPGWAPLLVTPPFPTYTSGHSTFSGAASELLGLFFGTDSIAFTLDGVGGPRSFGGFSQAAEEAGRSRIYGGIHFEFDNRAGLVAGRDIGLQVYQTQMVPEPSSLALAALGLLGLGLGMARSRRGGRADPSRIAAAIGFVWSFSWPAPPRRRDRPRPSRRFAGGLGPPPRAKGPVRRIGIPVVCVSENATGGGERRVADPPVPLQPHGGP